MDAQNYRLKLLIVIFLFIWFAPFGVFYLWLNRQILYKKIFIPLLISGIWGVFASFIILTQFLPDLAETLNFIEVPFYLTIFFYFIFLFYLCQIILSFIIDKKINSSPEFSKKYFNIAMIILIIGSVIIPIVWVYIIANSIIRPMYDFIGSMP